MSVIERIRRHLDPPPEYLCENCARWTTPERCWNCGHFIPWPEQVRPLPWIAGVAVAVFVLVAVTFSFWAVIGAVLAVTTLVRHERRSGTLS